MSISEAIQNICFLSDLASLEQAVQELVARRREELLNEYKRLGREVGFMFTRGNRKHETEIKCNGIIVKITGPNLFVKITSPDSMRGHEVKASKPLVLDAQKIEEESNEQAPPHIPSPLEGAGLGSWEDVEELP